MNNHTANQLRKFLIALVTITTCVVAVGWYTNILKVFHSLWVMLSVALLFPVLLVLLVLLGFLLVGLLLAPLAFLMNVFAEMSEPMEAMVGLVETGVEVGAEKGLESLMHSDQKGWWHGLFVTYYGFLARMKHPLVGGAFSGLIFGLILLATLVYSTIVKKEVATADILAATQTAMDQFYQIHGHYPEPDNEGHLSLPVNEEKNAAVQVVRDGFGRPLEYRLLSIDPVPSSKESTDTSLKTRLWSAIKRKAIEKITQTTHNDEVPGPLVSYTLHSFGYDLNDGDDDICVSFSSPELNALEESRAVQLTNLFKVTNIKTLRCSEP